MYPYDFNNNFGNFNNFNPYAMGNFGQNNNNYGQQMQQQQAQQQAGGLDIVTVQSVGQVEQVQVGPGQRRLIMVQKLDELHDAKHRIKNAYAYKSEYPDISKREYEIAVQELAHAEKDHASAVELVAKYAKEKGEPPEYMSAIWEEKHEHYIEKHARVKCMIDTYAKS